MPKLPPVVWLVIAAVVVLLVALSVITVVVMLRSAVRARVAAWPFRVLLLLLAAATTPWLVVWLAPLTIKVSISGTLALIGWLSLALLVFVVLVPVPLAAITAAAIWWKARLARKRLLAGAGSRSHS